MLNQLLRKKLEPLVDEWVEEGRAAGERVGTGDWGIGEEEVVGVWEWAGAAANALARGHAWGGEFTIEEGEGEGGIESEDDEGAAGDDDMDVEGGVQDGGERAVPPPPPLPMADLQRFMVKGKEEPGR